jgi:hypothetical protein
MALLEETILETLGALHTPVSAARLLHFTLVAAPTMRFSWSDFVESLNTLVAQKKIIEDTDGYTAGSGVESELASLGLFLE